MTRFYSNQNITSRWETRLRLFFPISSPDPPALVTTNHVAIIVTEITVKHTQNKNNISNQQPSSSSPKNASKQKCQWNLDAALHIRPCYKLAKWIKTELINAVSCNEGVSQIVNTVPVDKFSQSKNDQHQVKPVFSSTSYSTVCQQWKANSWYTKTDYTANILVCLCVHPCTYLCRFC